MIDHAPTSWRLLWITLVVVSACTTPTSQLPSDCTDTEAVRAQIFVPRCGSSSCHGTTTPSFGLDLVSPGVETRVNGVMARSCAGEILVNPGNATQSFLYQKLITDTPACGNRMPPDAPALPNDVVQCIRTWIDSQRTQSDGGADANSDATSDVPTCPAGAMFCGTQCTDVQTNNANCGSCGHACGAGQLCVAGNCACPASQTLCNGTCVDTQANAMNCGSCGRMCTASQVCSMGNCVQGMCPGGTMNCAGACVDTQTSLANCGGCGRICPAGQNCVAGQCACPSGTMLCNGSCVDTQSSAANCGGCGTACGSAQTCTAGRCTCAGGLTACGTACVDTNTDGTNCGRCAMVCGSGMMCTNGTCAGCGATVSFASQVQPIFTRNCTTGCHGGPRPSAGLSLVSGSSYRALVNVMTAACAPAKTRVVPGNVASSYLVNKISGIGMCSGNQMPPNGAPLSAANQTLIRAWICNGAPNN